MENKKELTEDQAVDYLLNTIKNSVKALRKTARIFSPGLKEIENWLSEVDREQFTKSKILQEILSIGQKRSSLTTMAAGRRLPELNSFYADLANLNAIRGHSYAFTIKLTDIVKKMKGEVVTFQDSLNTNVLNFHTSLLKVLETKENSKNNKSEIDRIRDISKKDNFSGIKLFWNNVRRKNSATDINEVTNLLENKIGSLRSRMKNFIDRDIYIQEGVFQKSKGPYKIVKNGEQAHLKINNQVLKKIDDNASYGYTKNATNLNFYHYKKDLPIHVQKYNFCLELQKLIKNGELSKDKLIELKNK